MPAAVAIPAIASVVGGGLAYAGARGAAGDARHSSDAALAFEREQEARRRQEYDQQQAAARQAWDAYQQQLAPYRAAAAGALAQYGIRTPGPRLEVSASGGGGTLSRIAGPPMAGPPMGQPVGQPMAGGPPPQAPMGQPMEQGQPLTLANLADWGNWQNYTNPGARR